MILVLFCTLLICVPVVMADDTPIADTGTTETVTTVPANQNSTPTDQTVNQTDTNSGIPYKVITPDAAASKFQNLFDKGYDAIAKTMTSLAVFVFAVCCVILLVASIFKIEAARKFGLGGIFCAGLGLLIFYSIPFIIAFLQGIGMYLNS